MRVKWTVPADRRVLRASGKGFLEVYSSELGELCVAHVKGNPREMGRQYGALVGDKIRRNLDRMVGLFTAFGLPIELVLMVLDNAWKRLQPYTPSRYLEEMAGIVEGAREAGFGVGVEDLQRLTAVTNFDLYKREERIFEFLDDSARSMLQTMMDGGPAMSCTMFAVWGSRTLDGKLLASRNLDWVSQTGMHEDRLLTVYVPEGGAAFVTMGYAGVIGALAGMNADGITLSEVGAFSTREELDGIPWTLMGRHVLEDADSLEKGVSIIEHARHTLGYNYMVADGDPENFGRPGFRPRAAAFETNFECCETFYEKDAKEEKASWTASDGTVVNYGMPIPEGVMRGDMAFGRRSRALQAADNGPGDPANDGDPRKGSTYLECHKPMHDMIRAYETGTEYVYPLRSTKVIEGGKPRKIGFEEALVIASTVAHNTEKLEESDWNVMSVVYAPTDGDFWVSFESCNEAGEWKNAPDSGYWRFSMKGLLSQVAE